MKEKHTQSLPSPSVPVVNAPVNLGLTAQEAALRLEAGLSNAVPNTHTRSQGQIVRQNLFTFFNLIFLTLAVALAIVGSFKNMMFLIVAAANTGIGIFQEIRAKRAVDKLTLVAAGTLTVIRDGQRTELATDQLVRDDIAEFGPGDQICADAVVREGQLFVNESLLTGEPDSVVKNPGDPLKSGSFVISGRALTQLTGVGSESYAARLAAEAKQNARPTKSEMMRSLSRLITVVGIILVPLGIFLFIFHFSSTFQGLPLRESIESTVAALVGMIPEGLYLLTSVAIAVSCLKLSRQRVLAQDMNCIETLAHVDVLCVDKTGTITEPVMEVRDTQPLNPEKFSYEQIEEILAAFYGGQIPENDTARAMTAQFAGVDSSWTAKSRVAFNSATKWSGADFGEQGCYLIGAPEFVLGSHYDQVQSLVEEWSARGCRCLLLAAYGAPLSQTLDFDQVTPVAMVYLSNPIRPAAVDTFRYFAEQGVSIRVISGDNPVTVSEIAREAGIRDAEKYVDAATLKTEKDFMNAVKEYTVFGRVTPEQKRYLIRAFKKQGHTVAMTGDGVNDVLALKEADCGIAMASGSKAATQVAQLVLMDSQFSAMPGILGEGRRVINNIQRAAALFLVKNIFSFVFTILIMVLGIPYPLQAIQLSLISALTIGVPSFFLAIEPNYAKVEGKFLRNVIRRAMPGGLTNVVMVCLASAMVVGMGLPDSVLNLMAVWILATVGIFTLYHVSSPCTRLRLVILCTVTAAMCACLFAFPGFFELERPGLKTFGMLITLILACPTVMKFFLLIFDNRMAHRDEKIRKVRKRLKKVR